MLRVQLDAHSGGGAWLFRLGRAAAALSLLLASLECSSPPTPSAAPHAVTTPRPRLLYVEDVETRLDDASIDGLVAFAAEQHFTHVALYRTHVTLPAMEEPMRRAVARLHAAHITVFAVVGAVEEDPLLDVRRVRAYLAAAPPEARFDGLVTEYEFWQTGNRWVTYEALLGGMRSLASERPPLTVATYLGWPDEAQARHIRERADIVLLHAYRADPAECAEYLAPRLALFANPARPVEIWPILSSERRDERRMDEEHFMGPWFSAQPRARALSIAESIVAPGIEGTAGIRVGGFAYYAYGRLSADLPRP